MVIPAPLMISKVFIKRFTRVGAIDAEHAVAPDEIKVQQNLVFSRLVSIGKIVNAGNGKYYLNIKKE